MAPRTTLPTGRAVDRRVRHELQQRFGTAPTWLVRAPGRVNLIGEHTDYNGGFVLPMAIDRAVWLALRPQAAPRVGVRAMDFDGWTMFDLDGLSRDRVTPDELGWAQYFRGMTWALQQAGVPLRGWEGVVAGDVPIGAGLSSSAAIELAVARAFCCASGWTWDPTEMARIAQQAENQWVGVACGIMDQLIAAAGRDGHALLIDCRSLETTAVPLPRDTVAVVLDTGTRRELTQSAYNERRLQCETAALAFGATLLRDVPLSALESPPRTLDPIGFRRARHVLTENARVLQAASAMRADDAETLGALMRESHASLRDDFEVSSAALDAIVECAEQVGCYGARMTGAGFGGCAVALVHAGESTPFVERTLSAYRARTAHEPQAYVCQATAGVSASLVTD